jgi:hypothetical protein
MRALLLARDPVIAEKHHRNEKAYLDKVVSGHSKAPRVDYFRAAL